MQCAPKQLYLCHTAFCLLLARGALQESRKGPVLARHSSFGDVEVVELGHTPKVFCLAFGCVFPVASNVICKIPQ